MSKADFSHTQMGNIIEVRKPINPGLPGNRNDETLQEAFSGSPIYSPGGNQAVKTLFEDLVMVGTLAGEGLKGSGFGFSSFNRDFVDAPNIEAVEKDNADKLVPSPYVPNVASPGPDGQVDNVVIPQKTAGGDFVGDSLLSPQKASADIATLTLGSLGLGTSSPKGK